MDNHKNIQSLSSKLLIVFWFSLIALPTLDSFFWISATVLDWQWFEATFPVEVTLPLSPTRAALGFLPSMLPGFVTMGILWQLILLFRLYKQGHIFTLDNATRYRKIANLLIIMPFAVIISDILLALALSLDGEGVELGFEISDNELSLFMIGFVVRVIAKVMEEASYIHQQQELTI